jgi:N utilization substance protein A
MVVSELRGEKIDIIPYNEEPARFVAKALSPARVREVLVDDEARQATVIVPDDQLSLAIGREGQNARLAAKLTGWRVDIVGESEFAEQANDDEGFEGEEEAHDGRCAAVLSAGRRCPNASLAGSRYCGLPQHQALARFPTNQVTVLAPLSDDEVTTLADPKAPAEAVEPIVARAMEAFEQAEAEDGATDEAGAEEVELDAGDAETPAEEAAASGAEEGAEPTVDAEEPAAEDAGEPVADAAPEEAGADEETAAPDEALPEAEELGSEPTDGNEPEDAPATDGVDPETVEDPDVEPASDEAAEPEGEPVEEGR